MKPQARDKTRDAKQLPNRDGGSEATLRSEFPRPSLDAGKEARDKISTVETDGDL